MYSTYLVYFILGTENNLQMQHYFIGPFYISVNQEANACNQSWQLGKPKPKIGA